MPPIEDGVFHHQETPPPTYAEATSSCSNTHIIYNQGQPTFSNGMPLPSAPLYKYV